MRLFVLLFLLTFQNLSYAFTFAPTSRLSEPEFLPVEQAFQLSVTAPKDGKLTATWQINDGYYLYQEQFALSGEHTDKLHFSPFPAGETKQDPYYGEVIVYRDQFTLPIYYDIKLAPGTQVNAVLSYQGCADKGLCYAPQKMPIQFTIPPLSSAVEKQLTASQSSTQTAHMVNSSIAPSEAESVSQLLNSNSLTATIIAVFGLGLLLSFTPCVLPMVPIVSAIVVGTRHSRLGAFYYSFIYVLAMALTYAAIGGLVGIFGTQLNLQAQLQNPILLIASAIIFALLALAMFGVYEIRVPSSWQQRFQVSTKPTSSTWKSTTSIFIAGVLSTLIVSPCVSAPLAGALLYISSQGNAWYGAMMLFVMAVGMGIPLLLVGLFGPKVLPKNGEWLHDIKVLMGFGLLAMAIWLITRWLPMSSHLYLWGILALGISSYFIHRAYKVASHPIRWFLVLVFFLIGSVEFIGGTTGGNSPLQPLEKFSSSSTNLEEKVTFDATITNLDELDRIIANQDNRPIVLDLYADWCISCKILEDMFASPDVLPLLDKVQLVRVDVTENSAKNQALMQKFGLFGPPSLIFLDKKGEERKDLTLMGEPTKPSLIDRLNFVTAP
ncbi:protein-disulfide reductase DsbD [Marinomonas rhizomae]|uniref:Thiol:disulfide interchange protein DsbD n=1 Tax=Marinomonas rhizomae TaxID=491948 RepID=A0A366JAG1_9GAMM|nr:protein-disulfide reductase DsbD [Marinomonas rhizomae]RBP83359.1 thiol:disulfide interchange protein DsbD [Marinomonas rhizomae]RNF73919.1 protein-disulfide reductase DsbD [Marinomonas rhizomae]